MKIKRLLLIPEIKWCGRFLISLSLFFRMWLTSRRLRRLAYAAPAFGLTFAFAWAVLDSQRRDRDPALLEQYLTLARQAVVDADIQDARLLFRRAQQLAPANKDITTELASSLFQLGERSEAYQMLTSIAPDSRIGTFVGSSVSRTESARTAACSEGLLSSGSFEPSCCQLGRDA